ncbi:SRPBCC domain-containing protein [Brachybacterium hainanense]|uniref:SRPBCC domain-containing protein n=1 Tax=Brachybacterium hainanense TaxID=1541174 RepID=A0ABV6RGD1_9MICO
MSRDGSIPAMDAVRRGLEIEADGEAVRLRIELTSNIAESPAQLWPHLTDPSELSRWYGPVGGDLREGGEYSAAGGAGGRILEVSAPHKLALTWEYGTNVDSLLLRLDPEDDGTTELSLVHTCEMPREIFAQYGPGASALGWEIALLGLAAYTGGWAATCQGEVPQPGPQWLTGPEGADFVRAWSIRWAAASVAAGTEEEAARRGELATATAYGAGPVGSAAR